MSSPLPIPVGDLVRAGQSAAGLFFVTGDGGCPQIELALVAEAQRLASSTVLPEPPPVHTGKIALSDTERCCAAAVALQAGISRRKIATALGMSRHTLGRIEEAFEAGGKLAPLKARVQRELASLVLDAAEETRDTLSERVVDVDHASWLRSVATVLGIGFDKHQLATGSATQIVEQRSGPTRADVDAWVSARLGAVDAEIVPAPAAQSDRPVDIESTGPALIGREFAGGAAGVVGTDASDAGLQAATATCSTTHPMSPSAGPGCLGPVAGGGGGVGAAGGHGHDDGLTDPQNLVKGAHPMTTLVGRTGKAGEP